MITAFKYINNIGLFANMNQAAGLQMNNLTLIYAENGRGKTTVSAIFRSLKTGDPLHVTERKTLGSTSDAKIILDTDNAQPPYIFENGNWNRNLPEIVIYDDDFVERNIYSGLSISPSNKKNLHELIIGEEGINLNDQLNNCINNISEFNKELRDCESRVQSEYRYGLTWKEFCDLENVEDIDSKIEEKKKTLEAIKNQSTIIEKNPIVTVNQVSINISYYLNLLKSDIGDIDKEAMRMVLDYFSDTAREKWVSDGLELLPHDQDDNQKCPFCHQHLKDSEIFKLYKQYFSESYKTLKRSITKVASSLQRDFDVTKQFELSSILNDVNHDINYWSDYIGIDKTPIELDDYLANWKVVYELLFSKISEKLKAPLEVIQISEVEQKSIDSYKKNSAKLFEIDTYIAEVNKKISDLKESIKLKDISIAQNELNKLLATKARFNDDIVAHCDRYKSIQDEKQRVKTQRDRFRTDLEEYRTRIFPEYQHTVNEYLGLFNAGYRIEDVKHRNISSGSSCNYNVLINNIPVPVTIPSSNGEPSFHNTLSAGDRNSLALAFFFAKLNKDNNRSSKIVIIDDPVSTLDDHRTMSTIQEIRRISNNVNQVIVLSHNKKFLCELFQTTRSLDPTPLVIKKERNNSVIGSWNVNDDTVTLHDLYHGLLTEYNEGHQDKSKEVAEAIRPYLEGFLRVIFPTHFVSGTMIGPFINKCRTLVGTANELLSVSRVDELDNIKGYANKFHHDTNSNHLHEIVNNSELEGYVRRTLDFVKLQ